MSAYPKSMAEHVSFVILSTPQKSCSGIAIRSGRRLSSSRVRRSSGQDRSRPVIAAGRRLRCFAHPGIGIVHMISPPSCSMTSGMIRMTSATSSPGSRRPRGAAGQVPFRSCFLWGRPPPRGKVPGPAWFRGQGSWVRGPFGGAWGVLLDAEQHRAAPTTPSPGFQVPERGQRVSRCREQQCVERARSRANCAGKAMESCRL